MNVESTHLGQKSTYPQHYDPSALVAVPRYLNREQYDLSEDNLPFVGVDVWHAYEFSFLLKSGTPVVGILKIVYPCNNPFLVESKSLKLYLNSFNMDRFGFTPQEGLLQVTAIIKTDLENLLKCKVEVNCFNHKAEPAPSDFDEYQILEENLELDDFNCTDYTENTKLLIGTQAKCNIKWGSHLLRSNCKITHQPDWGSIYISMEGNNLPDIGSFLKYIVSLRNENHFHEEICEMVFKRITDNYQPEELTISCLYTRRGGIDINPIRSLTRKNIPKSLSSHNLLDTPAFRQ
ncbi:MAG: NADPH-dependent 7-cyano-7-deazaguanine reductase QueF [Prolixibacteraceae bacterium]|jgi:7-cyano-7-deazaguanine reductase|nr:NADPH-dependent 7-cyano-7-deazaguanine reductase QueF [Prolixibacteraceae bacterium]